MKAYEKPALPVLLQAKFTSETEELHRGWQAWDLHFIDGVMNQYSPETFSIGSQNTRAIVMRGEPETGTRVLALSHCQGWKRSKVVQAVIHAHINNPNGTTIILPNNGSKYDYYHIDDEALNRVREGDLDPFYETQVRTLEAIQREYGSLGRIMVDGYSLGGLTALGIASVGSP
jgi:hypothetical protein